MAYRKLIDPSQQAWDVWEVVPSRVDDRPGDPGPMHRRIVVPSELQAGWLAFQSQTERRRIAPVPPDWHRLSDDELLTLLLGAPVVGKPIA